MRAVSERLPLECLNTTAEERMMPPREYEKTKKIKEAFEN